MCHVNATGQPGRRTSSAATPRVRCSEHVNRRAKATPVSSATCNSPTAPTPRRFPRRSGTRHRAPAQAPAGRRRGQRARPAGRGAGQRHRWRRPCDGRKRPPEPQDQRRNPRSDHCRTCCTDSVSSDEVRLQLRPELCGSQPGCRSIRRSLTPRSTLLRGYARLDIRFEMKSKLNYLPTAALVGKNGGSRIASIPSSRLPGSGSVRCASLIAPYDPVRPISDMLGYIVGPF